MMTDGNQMNELKQLIIHNLDVTDFLDIIGYGLEDLVDLLEDEIEEHYTRLMEACS